MNLLVVDDYVTNVSMLRVTLSKLGHTVVTARDGVEATTILQRESIDTVLTDWMMPHLDGIGLIRWIRSTLKPIPFIIVTTALGSSEAQAQALSAGADAFLLKPITSAQLEALLQTRDRIDKIQTHPAALQSASVLPQSSQDFTGIGVVAGTSGAVGIRTIFSAIDSLKNTAWFIVLHGPGWAAEALAEQMRSYTRAAVVIPTGGEHVEPNTIYIAPGDRHMLVSSKTPVIQLTTAPPENFLRPSADPLFISIANVFGRKALGVVLGGTGKDGSIGCGHIKIVQGAVIVQEPTNAVSSQMPQQIISLGLADQVLPLDKVAAAVLAQVRKNSVASYQGLSMDQTGIPR
jgi:two-component system, chemotaxis family, protein-glutamate methylesterase/glutaminase